MAVAFIDRKVGLDQYADGRIRDEQVLRLMRRVNVTVPDDLKHHRGQWGENGVNFGEARVSVRLNNGSVLTKACSHATGWPERPVSWQDLCAKFEDCASPVLGRRQTVDAITMIAELEKLHRVRDLIRTLVPAAGG